MSSFSSTENRAGVGYGFGIADTGSTQGPYQLGTIIRAQDGEASSALGVGEFIYLKSNATEVLGSLVTYNPKEGTTTLTTTSGKNTGQPVAVSMAAKAAGQYGFYQIGGVANMAKGVVDFGLASPVYTSTSTAGYVTATAGSGNQILGAITANAASVSSTTSLIYVTIDRPHLSGISNA